MSSAGGQWAWLTAEPFYYARTAPFTNAAGANFDTHGTVDKIRKKNSPKIYPIIFPKPIDRPSLMCYNTYRKEEEVKTMMTIEQIERALWLMEFKDRWTQKDWAERAELQKKLQELKNKA